MSKSLTATDATEIMKCSLVAGYLCSFVPRKQFTANRITYNVIHDTAAKRREFTSSRLLHRLLFSGGYPRGLKGESIPFGARIFIVAVVYDALTSERPYRSPINYVEAAAEIRKLSGSHFDPVIVNTFMAIAPKQLQKIAKRYQDVAPAESLSD